MKNKSPRPIGNQRKILKDQIRRNKIEGPKHKKILGTEKEEEEEKKQCLNELLRISYCETLN